LDEAREQWVAIFARDRADLGPAHAAELAAQGARYACGVSLAGGRTGGCGVCPASPR